MLRGEVVDINRQGYFTLEEANKIIPIIHRFNLDASQTVDRLIAKLEATPDSNSDIIQQLETDINGYINSWHSKIRKLGGIPKGLWIVDFDSQDGFLSWKFPENKVSHWHSYDQSFNHRVPLVERDKKATSYMDQSQR